MILLHPHRLERHFPDEQSREVMEKTVVLFEAKGKHRTAALEEGAILAFGEMALTPSDDGYVANGAKCYIGNGSQAA